MAGNSDNASFTITACLCAGIAAALLLLVHSQTDGLQNWTFEARRRQAVREGELQAPPAILQESWPEAASDAVYIVDFIYTRCPGICQGLGGQYRLMQRELAKLPDRPSVRLLSISFDLDHDTPGMLADYAERHGADPTVWRVSWPSDRAVAAALLHDLGIVAVDDGMGGYIHNSALHVVDAAGRVRGLYEYGEWRHAVDSAVRLSRKERAL